MESCYFRVMTVSATSLGIRRSPATGHYEKSTRKGASSQGSDRDNARSREVHSVQQWLDVCSTASGASIGEVEQKEKMRIMEAIVDVGPKLDLQNLEWSGRTGQVWWRHRHSRDQRARMSPMMNLHDGRGRRLQ
jgi:hypothetical protein